jgi:hypothetical protein
MPFATKQFNVPLPKIEYRISRPLQNMTNAVILANTLKGTGAGIQNALRLLDSGSSPE